METITLRRTEDGWMATNASYVSIFGCDTIPTAYTAHASAETVRSEIERRNPNALVVVEGNGSGSAARRRQ